MRVRRWLLGPVVGTVVVLGPLAGCSDDDVDTDDVGVDPVPDSLVPDTGIDSGTGSDTLPTIGGGQSTGGAGGASGGAGADEIELDEYEDPSDVGGSDTGNNIGG